VIRSIWDKRILEKMINRDGNRFGIKVVARKAGISLERLRYWERQGIVKPMYVRWMPLLKTILRAFH